MQRIVLRALELANYDFCPNANRYVRWLREPIGWFVIGAIGAGAIGASVAPQGWYICGGIIAMLALGIAWPWLALRGLTSELVFEVRRCHEGETIPATLIVTNRWPWPVWGLLLERGLAETWPDGTARAATSLARVSGWSRVKFQFDFRPERRGEYPLERPQLATGFPFGLWMARRPVQVAESLVVWPRVVALGSDPLPRGQRPSSVGRWLDRAGDSGDILSARPYREGDSLRLVHWIQTARRDTLIVSERQAVAQRQIALALDEPAYSSASPPQREQLDAALRVLASVARVLHSHRCELIAELGGDTRRIASHGGGFSEFLDRLARYDGGLTSARDDRFEEVSASAQLDDRRAGGARRAAGIGGAALRVVITTNERWRSGVGYEGGSNSRETRHIVLGDFEGADRGNSRWSFDEPWIALDDAVDPLRQLTQIWERRCHDDECAA